MKDIATTMSDGPKWYRPCTLCHARAKCRKEKVERGSKKCLMLLRKGERGRP